MTQLLNRLGKSWKQTIFCRDIKVHIHPTCQIELPLWNMQRRKDRLVFLFFSPMKMFSSTLFFFYLRQHVYEMIQFAWMWQTKEE